MFFSALVPTVARGTALALAAGGLALIGTTAATAAPASFTNTKRFSDASSTEWTVPPGVTSIDFVAVGGRGLRNATGVSGGLGVKLTGTMTVTPGQTLYVTTAGNGDTGGGGGEGAGHNGGGAGGGGSLNGRGGGASDIRFDGNELTDRKLVAGGGGGAYPGQNAGKGGGGDAGLAGVGQSGKPGDTGHCTNTATVAYGGSQTAGGAGGDAVANVCNPGSMLNGGVGSSGALGVGGTGKISASGSPGGAGGGGGYYGGGGASQAGGGGGSSYYDPSAFTLTTNEVTEEGPGVSFTYETLPGSLSVGDGYFDIAVGGPSYVLMWMELHDQAGTPISGEDFTFSSTNPAVTFTEFTKATGHYSVRVMAGPTAHVGPVTVTAHAAGLSDSTTFNITKGTRKVAITSSPPGNPLAGGSYHVTASGGTPQTPIRFTTGSSRCTVSDARNGSARVTFKHVGSCVITAGRGTDPNLLDTSPVTQTVTAYRGPQGHLSFTTKAKRPTAGKTYQARTKGSATGLRVRFKALTSACRVDAKGRVTFRKAGTCVLTAMQTGNADHYPSNTAIQVIEVKKKKR